MPVVVTAADRASFTRCRRQWDFGAALRQNLERRQTPTLPDLDRAVRDALAVYYFPGMWDWDRTVRLPLVGQGLERALTRQRQRQRERKQQQRGAADSSANDENWQEALGRGQALLDRYIAWAPNADRFAPVLVETDFEVDVLDPVRPDAALVTSVGDIIRYSGRVDMLAVDAHDAYWIVRHRVADGDWPPTEQLVADEESLAACWAWEQFYLGMAIAGTIYNELRSSSTPEREPEQPAPPPPEGRPRRWPWPRPRTAAALPAVRQHEPSGGGRSVPQHRRMYARAREPRQFKPIEQHTEDGFRRTLLRRSPADVAEAGRRLGADVADMIREDLDVYPEPSDDKCPPCPYLAPCQALMNGTDAEAILLAGYRKRPPEPPAEGRLGGRAWSLGRGAAPPKFSRHPRPG